MVLECLPSWVLMDLPITSFKDVVLVTRDCVDEDLVHY